MDYVDANLRLMIEKLKWPMRCDGLSSKLSINLFLINLINSDKHYLTLGFKLFDGQLAVNTAMRR